MKQLILIITLFLSFHITYCKNEKTIWLLSKVEYCGHMDSIIYGNLPLFDLLLCNKKSFTGLKLREKEVFQIRENICRFNKKKGSFLLVNDSTLLVRYTEMALCVTYERVCLHDDGLMNSFLERNDFKIMSNFSGLFLLEHSKDKMYFLAYKRESQVVLSRVYFSEQILYDMLLFSLNDREYGKPQIVDLDKKILFFTDKNNFNE